MEKYTYKIIYVEGVPVKLTVDPSMEPGVQELTYSDGTIIQTDSDGLSDIIKRGELLKRKPLDPDMEIDS